MAFPIRWSAQAAEDLKDIVQYIGLDDPAAAAHALAGKIILRIEKAANFPLSNRIIPEKNDESIREIILKPYRLIFQVDQSSNTMHVLRIWHAARGIPQT